MSYTKQRMKLKFSSKMSSAKDFLTSSSVNRKSKPEKKEKKKKATATAKSTPLAPVQELLSQESE